MLAVDIGNTNIKFCRFSPAGEILWREQLPTPEVNFAFVHNFFKASEARHVVLSSVVRPVNVFFEKGLHDIGAESVRVVDPARDTILPHRLQTPQTTGADRMLSALAASRRHPGEPVIVLQAGTALTVDSVGADGVFNGGFILPGPQMWLDSLSSAAQLPYFPPENIDWTSTQPGNSTQTAILGGAVHGLRGAACGAVTAHRAACPELAQARVVLTGGWGAYLADATGGVYEADLVLHGLFFFSRQFR